VALSSQADRLHHNLIDVTPHPLVPWLEGPDNGVSRRVEVLGRVLVLRRVAATNVPAD